MSSILDAALSGIKASNIQSGYIANNISNALVEDYQRIEAQDMSVINAGTPNGVNVSATYGAVAVEASIIQDNRLYIAESNLQDTIAKSMVRMSDMLCKNEGSKENLGFMMQSIINSYAKLSSSINDSSSQDTVITDISTLASFLKKTSEKLLTMRKATEESIEQSVSAINQHLSSINDYNKAISGKNGVDTLALESARNKQMKKLSKYMDFQAVQKETGELYIKSSKSSIVFLDSSPNFLKFDQTSNMYYDSVYPTDVNGIKVKDPQGGFLDVTAQFSKGMIAGNIFVRDKDIPAIQAELDEFAKKFINSINSINNLGVSPTPRSNITGSTTFTDGAITTFAGQGVFRTTIMDNKFDNVGTFDIDLSTFTSIGDLVSALNTGVSNIDANAKVELDAKNCISISTTTNGNHFAFTSVGPTEAIDTNNQKNISHSLGLSDLILCDSSMVKGLASTLKVMSREKISMGELNKKATPNVGDKMLNTNDNTIVNKMQKHLSDSVINFSEAGYLGPRSQTLIQYGTAIVSQLSKASALQQDKNDTANEEMITSNTNLKNAIGVNTLQELQNLNDQTIRSKACTKVISAYKSMMDDLFSI
jgi:flagellar hook-associated protein 1 FlgK